MRFEVKLKCLAVFIAASEKMFRNWNDAEKELDDEFTAVSWILNLPIDSPIKQNEVFVEPGHFF